ncbi:hypothetical protein ACFY8P_35505 [Streptomyces sp. NPDC012693]|uniref:hypothetical protein n=1 Tax=Streptomyces sp. NPDC012693 TaxID=3364844 RepID=UPI003680B1DD
MRRCAYCSHPIEGEAIEISTESASGARPTAYWHKHPDECRAARMMATGRRSSLRRRLSHI